MGKKISRVVSKAEFAAMAGVNASSVTKAAKKSLSAAMHGDRVDIDHPDAIAYLSKHDDTQLKGPAIGLDALYNDAIELSLKPGSFTINKLRTVFNIGPDRAKAIYNTVIAADIKSPPKPTLATHVRGVAAKNEKSKAEATDDDIPLDIPDNIQDFADMTLRELIYKFGTDRRFVDWLRAAKDVEAIHASRLKNAATEGTLISRTLVQEQIIDTVDIAFRRMLTDCVKSITVKAVSAIKAGANKQDIEDLVGKQLGSFIRPTKSKIVRVLNNA